MKNLSLSVYERITNLICFLSEYNEEEDRLGSCVSSISKRLHVPAESVRRDLIALRKAGLSIAPEDIVERFRPDDDSLDEKPVYLDTEVPLINYSAPYLLFADSNESDLFLKGNLPDLMIKDTPADFSFEIKERIADIETAISKKRRIDFLYKSPAIGTVEHINAAPVMVFHNRSNDKWYCIVFPDDKRVFSYRLDRVKPRSSGHDIRILNESYIPPDHNDERFKKIHYMWGMEYDNEKTDPVHVKIRISKDTANIINKIRFETADRIYSKLYEKDGFWYYEDEVIGFYGLKSWLLSFGSSVKVIEPAFLAEAICEEARKNLENYETII